MVLETPAGNSCCQELADRLAARGLLRLVDKPHPAQLRLDHLTPRERPSAREPAAILGPLAEPGWVITDREGELLGPFLPDKTDHDADRLVGMVLDRARQLAIEELAAVSRQSRKTYGSLVLMHRVEGLLREVEPLRRGGEALLAEGEEVAVEIRNDGATELWSDLLDLGLTGTIERVHPERGAGAPIAPGSSTWVEGLKLFLPESFPFHGQQDPQAWGRERLILLTSTAPVDLDALFIASGRVDEGSALGRILSAILAQATLPSPEDLADPSWAAVTCSFIVRRSGRRSDGPTR